jgi:hypothetical protein
LPEISGVLTAACAWALRECFVNAMLHAEHDAGVIDVEFGDGIAVFSNPGLPRTLTQGESEARNYRLMRIFVMAGLAHGAGRGLDIIRECDANFSLLWDMLKLAAVSELHLSAETEPAGMESAGMDSREPEKTDVPSPGWLPVVQDKFMLLTHSPTRNVRIKEPDMGIMETDFAEFEIPDAPIPEPYNVREYVVSETGSIDEINNELNVFDEFNEIDEPDVSEDDEYLGTDENEEEDDFPPLVRKVRETPRMPLAVVRDAILELCAEYRSLPELASTLARSENSLRRHYVTSMVKEGLLEMEYPDRVGHPDQRYTGRLD